jgi:O-6-methylguanine DNA methyltransferase
VSEIRKAKNEKRRMSEFTRKVYRVVLGIPLGEVRTYKWVAAKAGNPLASRAVGQIMRRNPYPLIIPCHRVVACDNKPGGYSGGVSTKMKILEVERQIRSCLENRK